MPDKTHGELIRELFGLAATLTERVDNLRNKLERLGDEITQVADQLNELDKKVALQELHVSELREEKRESIRRIWMIIGPVLGAFVGALVTFLLRR